MYSQQWTQPLDGCTVQFIQFAAIEKLIVLHLTSHTTAAVEQSVSTFITDPAC